MSAPKFKWQNKSFLFLTLGAKLWPGMPVRGPELVCIRNDLHTIKKPRKILMPQLFLPMLALLTGVAGPALSADFHKALDAAKRGDYAIALKEWEPLAEQGHTIAQFNLGLLFERTDQASRDFKSALKWYTRAAGQGHAVAQFNLGGMYANGRGVGQDQVVRAFQNDRSRQNVGNILISATGVKAEHQKNRKETFAQHREHSVPVRCA